MKRKYILPLFLVIQIILIKVIAYFPEFIEKYYSNGLYPILSKTSRITLGWLPFSFGDIAYSILLLWVIFWFIKNRKENWKTKGLAIISTLSIAYFLFHFLWALNYYRLPLFTKMNIKTEYTQEQLVAFTQKLITKTNQTHLLITKDTALKVVSKYTAEDIYKIAPKGYDQLSKTYPYFTYEEPSIKTSLFSYPLTYMGFGGYLNPFTNEAQVNNRPPAYHLPAVTCHEMAHQMGFASESECNFIGFLAATHNEDLFFNYAGYTYALRYCLVNIGNKDEKKLKELLKTIHPGILKNFKESEDFWIAHRSFIDKGFELFYDNFLKMNQQKDGMESYSKFVDLLVNYYSKRNL